MPLDTPAFIIICLTFAESPPLAVIVTLVRLVQKLNVLFPILVTLSGIVTLVRLLQPVNTIPPMLVTLSGISMLVRLLH